MTSTTAEPRRRTADDQECDQQERLESFAKGAYKDWPNEAGFDGLTDEQGPLEVKVAGEIPVWAAGTLYRTGPGDWKVNDTSKGTYRVSHWFDGLAQTHRFDIITKEDGTGTKLFYSSRRQSESLVARIKKDGVKAGVTFGQRADPCVGILGKMMSTFYSLKQGQSVGGKAVENVCVTVLGDVPGVKDVAVKLQESPVPKTEQNGQTLGHRSDAAAHSAPIWLGTDTTTMKQMDPDTLEPLAVVTQAHLHPDLKGALSCAHAERDPVTGDFFNVNLAFGKEAAYRIFRISASTGKTDILATISRPDVNPAYIHSFFLSPSFVILCVPSTHYGARGLKVLWERNLVDAIVPFSPRNRCRWFVIDRLHGRGTVAEFDTDAGFFFHTVNGFEEEDAQDQSDGTVTVTCDVVDFSNHDLIHSFYYDVMMQRDGAAERFFTPERVAGTQHRLGRYQFRAPRPTADAARNLSTKIACQKLFSIPGPHAGELPTINPAYRTRRHRYVYMLASRGVSTLLDAIVKTDTDTHDVVFWDPPKGHTPGEAIFVARPGGEGEDDGVLLSLVLDGVNARSYLLCLDARTMREVGRGELERAVTMGFHGMHRGKL